MSKAVLEKERSSSASPGTPAMGCSSPAIGSPRPRPCSATTSRPFPTSRRRSARPAGTVHGVSAFQIQFASTDITTPGDHADVLIAMNPAALKADLHTVERGGTVILNEDAFTRATSRRRAMPPIRGRTAPSKASSCSRCP